MWCAWAVIVAFWTIPRRIPAGFASFVGRDCAGLVPLFSAAPFWQDAGFEAAWRLSVCLHFRSRLTKSILHLHFTYYILARSNVLILLTQTYKKPTVCTRSSGMPASATQTVVNFFRSFMKKFAAVVSAGDCRRRFRQAASFVMAHKPSPPGQLTSLLYNAAAAFVLPRGYVAYRNQIHFMYRGE